jgi:hypothetical protein
MLIQRPPGESNARWQLWKIDSVSGQIIRRINLPTMAPQLSVIPGPPIWAFVEKEEVSAPGLQAIPGVVFMNSWAVENY